MTTLALVATMLPTHACIIEHHFDAPLLIRFSVNQHDSMAKPCTAQLSNTADFDEAYLCLLGIL